MVEGDRSSCVSCWPDRVSAKGRVWQQAYAAVRKARTAALIGVEIFIEFFFFDTDFTDLAKCAVRILGPSRRVR